jgi:hypothetical protein
MKYKNGAVPDSADFSNTKASKEQKQRGAGLNPHRRTGARVRVPQVLVTKLHLHRINLCKFRIVHITMYNCSIRNYWDRNR